MGGTDNLADRVEITLVGEHGEMIEVREYHFDGVGRVRYYRSVD